MHSFRQFYEGIYMPVLFSTHSKSVMVLSAPINGPPPIPLFQVFSISISSSLGHNASMNSHVCIVNQVSLCILTSSQFSVQWFSGSIIPPEFSHCKSSCSPRFVTQSNFALLQYLLNTCIFTTITALSKGRAVLFQALAS